MRVADNEAFGAQDVGDARLSAAPATPEAAKRAAEQIADYLAPLDSTWICPLAADVVDPLRSDTMGLRSFSSDASVAADMVRAEVEGFREEDALLRQTPGHWRGGRRFPRGRYHHRNDQRGVETVDLVPFRAAIEAGCP